MVEADGLVLASRVHRCSMLITRNLFSKSPDLLAGVTSALMTFKLSGSAFRRTPRTTSGATPAAWWTLSSGWAALQSVRDVVGVSSVQGFGMENKFQRFAGHEPHIVGGCLI